jgi:hypothetical protein
VCLYNLLQPLTVFEVAFNDVLDLIVQHVATGNVVISEFSSREVTFISLILLRFRDRSLSIHRYKKLPCDTSDCNFSEFSKFL